ncbi:MAG: HDIG domain-containing metalloprotein [Candidatus Cloacimonadales bacterium]
MEYRKQITYISIIASIIIALCYLIFSYFYGNNPRYQLKIGQISQHDIKAPFSFTVLKPESEIQREIYELTKNRKPIYKISENAIFQMLKELDYIFIEINNHFENEDTTNVIEQLARNKYHLSNETYQYLQKENNRQHIYNFLSQQIQKINTIPIYDSTFEPNEFRINDNNRIQTISKNKIYSIAQAKQHILKSTNSLTQKQVISNFLDNLLISNIEEDGESIDEEKLEIRKSLNLIVANVAKGEVIIESNKQITENDLNTIESLKKAYIDKKSSQKIGDFFVSTIGLFLYNMIVFSLYFVLKSVIFERRYDEIRHALLVTAMLIINSIITIIISFSFDNKYLIIFPFSLFIIILSYLFIPAYAFLFSFFNILLLAQYSNWDYYFILISIFPSILAIYSIKKYKHINFFILFLYMVFGYVITVLAIGLFKLDHWAYVGFNIIYGIISCFISILLAHLLIPVIEKHFTFFSKQTLLELLDFDQPLLKKLAKEAPGTYYHSLTVGSLAEAAAEAINANPLIARVGSYYHDIGKLYSPEIFIENNPNSTELHDKMLAKESAQKIKNHVSSGIKLVKQHKLPSFITDIIEQHHGNNKIKYFFHKAQTNAEPISEEDFFYLGPTPHSREAAIVMIADIIESTAKSLKEYTPDTLKKVIDDTVMNLIQEKQLEQAPLTLAELHTIKNTMLPILESIYRKRIEYPEETNKE